MWCLVCRSRLLLGLLVAGAPTWGFQGPQRCRLESIRVGESRDYYEDLGVKNTATTSEVKAAFRTAAKTLHPDVALSNGMAKREVHAAVMRDVKAARALLGELELDATRDGLEEDLVRVVANIIERKDARRKELDDARLQGRASFNVSFNVGFNDRKEVRWWQTSHTGGAPRTSLTRREMIHRSRRSPPREGRESRGTREKARKTPPEVRPDERRPISRSKPPPRKRPTGGKSSSTPTRS